MSKPRNEELGPAQKPWYGDGLRFSCTNCGVCCTGKPGYVWVNDDEISLISAYMGLSRSEFREKYLTLTHGGYSLIEKPNYDCILLDKRRCQVYEIRPHQCRAWPFWKETLASPEAWELEAHSCPGMGKGKLYTLKEIDAILQGKRDT